MAEMRWPLRDPRALQTTEQDALRHVVKKKVATLNRALGFTMERDPEPVRLESRAHRSLLRGHAIAARMVEEARPRPIVTFLPYGRSGAKTETGLIAASRDQRTASPQPGQRN